MVLHLSSSPLPPKPQRVRGVGRVIADSWTYDSPLAALVLDADRLYLQA